MIRMEWRVKTKDDGKKKARNFRKGREKGSPHTPSPVSINQIKMEEDQTSDSTSDMGGSIPSNQSTGSTLSLSPISINQIKMEADQTSDSTSDMGGPLPGNQSSGSTLSLSPVSVTQIKMEVVQSPDSTSDMGDPLPGNQLTGSIVSPSPFSVTQIKSSSSNKVLQSSSTHSQRSISQQLDGNQQTQTSSQRTFGESMERGPRSECKEGPFDIFRTTNPFFVKLKKPLHVLNKERKKEVEHAKNATMPKHLRSGMVLLKNFINHIDQVKIVNICRVLGIGAGGFYRPGYKDGPVLHLQMMCLGLDWDPGSRLYRDSRPFDGVVPPKIPNELRDLVNGALHAALNFLGESAKSVDEIPTMSPDICIVNFYSKSGKLGLHQDRDESPESLEKGLPVVSFSIGDSAEFLFSDERDADKPDKVILESGDVLIFGGKARHIFHGVPNIISDTAPDFLIDQTNLRPGRLNLTFRQF